MKVNARWRDILCCWSCCCCLWL